MTKPSETELREEIRRLELRLAELKRELPSGFSTSEQASDASAPARLIWSAPSQSPEELLAAMCSIIDSSTNCIYMKDLSGRYVMVNSQAAKVVGKSRDELLGKTDREVFDDALAENFSNADRQVLSSGEAQTFEEIIPSESGEPRVFQATKAPCRDSQGKLIGLVGISREITKEKQAEIALRQARADLERKVDEKTRELRTANRVLREDLARREAMERQLSESEERFRAIVEGVPIPLAISRPSDGRILYVNQTMSDLAGAPADQLVGRDSFEFYQDPDDREIILRLLKTGNPVSGFELQVRRLDGSPAWILLSLQRIKYEGSEAALCAAIDVTTRKQAEISLRKEQQLMQRLLDTHQRERQLTAYEIHDGMVQEMTAAVMLLESTKDTIPDSNEKAHAKFDQAVSMVRRAIDEARRLIEGLAPPVLEAEGILPALNSLIDDMSAKSDMSVTMLAEFDRRRLVPALEMSVFRIVQESLNNAWRHGESKLAIIRLKDRGQTFRLSVRDFGKGFEMANVSSTKYGLRGIRERARLLGGRARIISVPGKGTLVTAELPIIELRPTGIQ